MGEAGTPSHVVDLPAMALAGREVVAGRASDGGLAANLAASPFM